MTSYFNTCDVTVANSNHTDFLYFFSRALVLPPLWKRFRHPWIQAVGSQRNATGWSLRPIFRSSASMWDGMVGLALTAKWHCRGMRQTYRLSWNATRKYRTPWTTFQVHFKTPATESKPLKQFEQGVFCTASSKNYIQCCRNVYTTWKEAKLKFSSINKILSSC